MIIMLSHYLVLAAILFCVGLWGVLSRRNAVGILMGVELMLNAANINFVAFSNYITPDVISGQIFSIFVMAIAAAEAAVALAIILNIYRVYTDIDVTKINMMKW